MTTKNANTPKGKTHNQVHKTYTTNGKYTLEEYRQTDRRKPHGSQQVDNGLQQKRIGEAPWQVGNCYPRFTFWSDSSFWKIRKLYCL